MKLFVYESITEEPELIGWIFMGVIFFGIGVPLFFYSAYRVRKAIRQREKNDIITWAVILLATLPSILLTLGYLRTKLFG